MAAPKGKFDAIVNDDTIDNTDDLPEFNDNNTVPQSTGIGREKLNFDSKRFNEEHKRLEIPKGDWTRTDRWDFDEEKHIVVRTDDSVPGDLDPRGRTVFLFAGKPDARVVNGISHQPHFFMRISPDNRYKEDDPQTFDLPRRLFDMARETYLTIHGEELKGEDQLIYLMTEDHIVLSTFNPPDGDGPMVIRIKPPQGKRRGR